MKEFDYSLVKNPEYFKDGRMEAHSDHITYANVEEASTGETSYRHSLNGIWKFHYARNYGNTIKGFEREDYSCKDWDDIRVPAHIQMEGYDAPQYANVQYPWEGHEDIHPGEIPEHFNPVASYVKYFTVPEQMKGKRLFISFQGAESGIALWLNGQFVGYSEDSFTPSEFELTDYVKEGKISWQLRCSSDSQQLVEDMISIVSPEFTGRFIFIQYRMCMCMISRSAQSRMRALTKPGLKSRPAPGERETYILFCQKKDRPYWRKIRA